MVWEEEAQLPLNFPMIISAPSINGLFRESFMVWATEFKSLLICVTSCFRGTGPNGEVVLHTIANNGGCSDKWGQILQISKKKIDEKLTRALKYKFQRGNIPQPLRTTYKYWQEGFWYFQKPGTNFDLTTIRQWAKRPLIGQDVFLVDRAFNNFGGWLQDTLR
ncbi:uncharacterized protein LOC111323160, partial [Stylophora pistillata]|uniref:uncharacterized protein LOC111323160 n=1 Tax=Stylophora pistillata TaxID=50429 RepID=UPI000C040E64